MNSSGTRRGPVLVGVLTESFMIIGQQPDLIADAERPGIFPDVRIQPLQVHLVLHAQARCFMPEFLVAEHSLHPALREHKDALEDRCVLRSPKCSSFLGHGPASYLRLQIL